MKKKVLGLFMAATMVASMLAGCGSKAATSTDTTKTEPATETVAETSDAETPAPQIEKIKVAYMPNYASLATIAAAEGTGAFEQYGFDVELVEFADGPTIISAMESGSIDYAYIGTGAHKLCVLGRADVICFAQLSNADAVIGNTEKGVSAITDLKGKKVAYSSGTSSEEILKATLGKENMTLSDIEAVDMDASAITTAMISGAVDACATWSPNTLTIYNELGEKAVELGANKDFVDTNVSVSSFIAMPDKVKNNREQVVRFVEAVLAGSDFRSKDENFETNCKFAADLTGLSLESMTGCKLDAEWVDATTIHELVNNGQMQSYYEIQQKNFLEAGAIEEEVPIENYVHFDIMNEAYEAYK